MSDILSQDEVDALLQGVSDGAIPVAADGAADAPRGGVRAIDLTNQERSLRGKLPGLELCVDRFTRILRASLTSFFGQLPSISIGGVELVKFGGFTARLPRPVSLQLFRMIPLRGQGLLAITAPLVGALLQTFFGGNPGRKTAIPQRDFSGIEQRVLERLGARVLRDLGEAWSPVEAIDFTFVRSETNPQFATIVSSQDLVVVLDLRIEVEGCENGVISICLPNASLDPIRSRLQRVRAGGEDESQTISASWSERLRAALVQADVEVTAELGSRRMSLRDVVGLKVGDVITLPTGRDGPVFLTVAGKPRYQGTPGIASGNNAVRVTGPMTVTAF